MDHRQVDGARKADGFGKPGLVGASGCLGRIAARLLEDGRNNDRA
jgi:hypothetical protein